MEMQHKRPFTLMMIILLTLTTIRQIGTIDSVLAWAGSDAGNAHEEPARLHQIEKLLSHSPTGANALALMRQYGVQVKFAEGGGTGYRVESNTIVIDLGHEPLRAALALVHELNHARVFHEGTRADIHEHSKEEYVMMKLQEEAESVSLSIEARMELAKAGLDVSAVAYPLEREYEAAVSSISSNVPGMSDEDLNAFGQRAGRKLVFDALMSGEVRGSRSGLSYPEKFGQRWDKANALPSFLNDIWQILSLDA
jgi:hypothetical protein